MTSLEVRGLVQILEDHERRFELQVRSLTLKPGDRLAIIGPSGSGKTTLLDMLALSTPPNECEHFSLANGRDVTRLLSHRRTGPLARLRARHYGYVLQQANLVPFLTVEENVRLTQRIAHRGTRAYARGLLQRLGITAFRAFPAALSVGQRQRVAIARAFAHHPEIILCDEPTAALDPVSARETLRLCVEAAGQAGAALAIVTHDADLARDMGFSFVPMHTEQRGRLFQASIDDRSGVPAS